MTQLTPNLLLPLMAGHQGEDQSRIRYNEAMAVLDVSAARRGAGFVIAASDSLNRHKIQADLVCDGTKDEEQIQEAIDDVGGRIFLLPGTFVVDQNDSNVYCILIDVDDLELLFMAGAIVKLNDNQHDATETLYVIRIRGALSGEAHNVSIWGPGILDGNLANNTRIAGTGVEQHRGISIDAFNTHVRIGGGLHIKNVDGQAIKATGNNNINSRAIFDGLRITDCGEGLVTVRMFECVLNNAFVDGMDKQDGLEFISNDRLTITNCVVLNTNDDCLDLFASAAGGQDWGKMTVTGCCLGPRLAAGASVNKEIVAMNNGSSGFILENVVFCGNFIDMGNAGDGIVIGPDDSFGNGNTRLINISGNVIDGTGAQAGANGINVDSVANRCLIANNLIHDCPGDAIDLSDTPTHMHIKGNSGWDNGGGINPAVQVGTNIYASNDFV